MVPRQYGDEGFDAFLSLMEGQWEARDTASHSRIDLIRATYVSYGLKI